MKRFTAALLAALLLCCALMACAEEAPSVTGKVIEIEKYGHALLDITIEDFNAAGFALGDIVTVKAGSFEGDMPYFNGYYVDHGEMMLRAYPGHTNIAVCINYGKFAETAGIGVGDEVTITLCEKAGALTLQEISNLSYTNNRSEFPSDEAFANYRPIVMGEIGEGKLYRSCSPVDNSYGRAAYANALAEAAGIKSVMNLANTEEEMAACFDEEGFASDYYKALYEEGNVITLGLPVNFTSDEFAEGIVKGLSFLSEHDAPFLIHCTEGKDRAGFTAMVIEMLMGATEEEIIADYMLSYYNYYGVEPGTSKYDMIVEKNIKLMIATVSGGNRDLQAGAKSWLTDHGMSEDAMTRLEEKLN